MSKGLADECYLMAIRNDDSDGLLWIEMVGGEAVDAIKVEATREASESPSPPSFLPRGEVFSNMTGMKRGRCVCSKRSRLSVAGRL